MASRTLPTHTGTHTHSLPITGQRLLHHFHLALYPSSLLTVFISLVSPHSLCVSLFPSLLSCLYLFSLVYYSPLLLPSISIMLHLFSRSSFDVSRCSRPVRCQKPCHVSSLYIVLLAATTPTCLAGDEQREGVRVRCPPPAALPKALPVTGLALEIKSGFLFYLVSNTRDAISSASRCASLVPPGTALPLYHSINH